MTDCDMWIASIAAVWGTTGTVLAMWQGRAISHAEREEPHPVSR
jgi:hypothetical protein